MVADAEKATATRTCGRTAFIHDEGGLYVGEYGLEKKMGLSASFSLSCFI